MYEFLEPIMHHWWIKSAKYLNLGNTPTLALVKGFRSLTRDDFESYGISCEFIEWNGNIPALKFSRDAVMGVFGM